MMAFLYSIRSVAIIAVLAAGGVLALGGRAAMAQEFDILFQPNGARFGGIEFPAASGSGAAGVTFDFQAVATTFTELHITSLSWALDPSGGVASLSLSALIGDDPCDPAHGPCTNKTLNLNANTFQGSQIDCFGSSPGLPPPPCNVFGGAPLPVEFVPLAPAYTCVGFEPPLDGGPVTVKKNRVLPFKAELLDEYGFALSDDDLSAAPVLQVTYNSGIGGTPADVTEDALPAGLGMTGNVFVFAGSNWRFNLKTSNFTAPGTYTATMASGNGAEYGLDPTCTAQFVVE